MWYSVYGSCTFLRSILDLLNSLNSASATHKLRKQPRTDLQTDACQLVAGAYFCGNCFYLNFATGTPDLAGLYLKETAIQRHVHEKPLDEFSQLSDCIGNKIL